MTEPAAIAEDQSPAAKSRLFRDPGSRPFAILAAQRAHDIGRPDLFWHYFAEGKAHPELVMPAVPWRSMRKRHPNR